MMPSRICSTVALPLAMWLVSPAIAMAHETDTPASEAEPERPAATLADMEWLEGHWIGTGIGGHPAGETFSYAGDGQMVGHFWQLDESGGIRFYELITITPDGESLVMRLKHFNHDLAGWEEKPADTAVVFPLRERTENSWRFGAATFTRDGPNKLKVSVVIRRSDGSTGSFDFDYVRAEAGEVAGSATSG